MPRPQLIRTAEAPYHIVSRSNHKLWFNIPMLIVWEIFKDALIYSANKYPIELHAGVCMSNHYHMLIRTPHEDIDSFMFEFNSRFSKKIRMESGLINKMLGKRYHRSIVSDERYYNQVLKYIYRNPVKADICQKVESYPYSLLYEQINNIKFTLPIKPFVDVIDSNVLNWLNEGHSEIQDKSIRSGLRKSIFTYANLQGKKYPPKFSELT